jgi:hypothetical protein
MAQFYGGKTAAADGEATYLRLETGISQPEALTLYRAAGYAERGPFGHYTADPLSLFMENRWRLPQLTCANGLRQVPGIDRE